VSSPASFLLDRADFFQSRYAYEFFSTGPNELVLYNAGQRFRYLPKVQSDLTRPLSHSWVRTALQELVQVVSSKETSRVSAKSSSAMAPMGPTPSTGFFDSRAALPPVGAPLFLLDTYDHFPGYMYEDGEVGRIMQAHDAANCEQHCREIGCTAFVMYGAHHCTFFASEPWAIRHLKTRYSNGSLAIRRPISDVNGATKLLSGFLLASLILVTACAGFVICSKSSTPRSSSEIVAVGEEMFNRVGGVVDNFSGSMMGSAGHPKNVMAVDEIAMSDFPTGNGKFVDTLEELGQVPLVDAAEGEDEPAE